MPDPLGDVLLRLIAQMAGQGGPPSSGPYQSPGDRPYVPPPAGAPPGPNATQDPDAWMQPPDLPPGMQPGRPPGIQPGRPPPTTPPGMWLDMLHQNPYLMTPDEWRNRRQPRGEANI